MGGLDGYRGGVPQGLHSLSRSAASTALTYSVRVLSYGPLTASTEPVTPIVGVSSVAQLDEIMAARDLTLDADALAVLNSVS